MARLWLIVLHGAVYLGAAWLLPPVGWLWAAGLAGLLIWVSETDARTTEIPDMAQVCLVGLGLFWVWVERPEPLADHLLGLVLWPALMGGVAWFYHRHRGWQGLGLGDVKLMAGLGLWAGFQGGVWLVLAASLAGIAVLMLRQRRSLAEIGTSAVAFGPFLCLSGWVIILSEGKL